MTRQEDVLDEVELFGGAVKMRIPKRFFDISKVRQVPDSQEVFADANTDQSFVLEMLSMSEDVSDQDIARYLFDDMADANGAESRSIVTEVSVQNDDRYPNIVGNVYKAAIIGEQQVAKYNEQATNTLHICMGVIRIKNHSTDVLLTFNNPVAIHPESSSSKTSVPEGNTTDNLFWNVFKSIEIVDYGLFE
ncbi:RanGEF [Acrasis kona]|uniref:RanGEF n=1 Tax=Acrasis kona TaxID=1008807 RepID=A0AAW2YNS9_9EUKA